MCVYMYMYNIDIILLKYFYLCSKYYKINKKSKLRLIVIHPSSTSNPVVEVYPTCNLCDCISHFWLALRKQVDLISH